MHSWRWVTRLPGGQFQLDTELSQFLSCSSAQRLKWPWWVVVSVPASACVWEAGLTSVEDGGGVSNGKSGTSQWVQGVTFNVRAQV